MRPKAVIAKMVEYYRGFQASNDIPNTHGDMFLDLALSKKGVCRHRAFAFLITALEIGIPTRMVVNEAHAWVEVFDGQLWHRVDLGGAALDLVRTMSTPTPIEPQLPECNCSSEVAQMPAWSRSSRDTQTIDLHSQSAQMSLDPGRYGVTAYRTSAGPTVFKLDAMDSAPQAATSASDSSPPSSGPVPVAPIMEKSE